MVLVAALLLVGCGAPTGREVRGEAAGVTAAVPSLRPVVHALNDFGLDLLRARPVQDENLALATYPLARSLAMARAGARAETRRAMDEVLRLEEIEDPDAAMAALDRAVRAREGEKRSATRKGSVALTLPALLWAQEDTRFAPEFLDLLSSAYATGVRVADFRSDPDDARDAMNRWATEATDDAVDLLAPRGAVSELTRFVPASAGVVRAPWALRFEPARTTVAPFAGRDGSRRSVATMTATSRTTVRTATGDGWEAVELPYLGGELAMLLVVPDGGRFDEAASRFDAASLAEVTDALVPSAVTVRVPRFEVSSVLDLDDELRALGLADAFGNTTADFSGVSPDEVLALSTVLHVAYAAVDEEGSDEDAVTVVPPGEADDGHPVVAVDRPFLFVVRDVVTGLVVQAGRVIDPR